MSSVSFVVADVFDLKGRAGLLVAGDLLSGEVCSGDVLCDSTNGRRVRVLGIELLGKGDSSEVTLIVDRRDADSVRQGCRLIGC
jgi:selenocysteine-specific translation elongation factor